ncbi:MAG: nucleotide exchange factor GrpE [Candidatus Omnitrophica bacterium]|nr:nucleotide exchange factor GrpE [Candidatus Omnitrophota bacterium]
MDKKEEQKNNKKETIINQQQQVKKEEEKIKLNLKAEELLRKKEQDYNALWDKYLRSCAEFENIRKRLEREKQEAIKYANEGIIVELLNILDDLERTVSSVEKNYDLTVFLKGIEMVLAHLYELLKKYGVKPIEAQNKPFDPNLCEALLQEERNDLPEHTVVEELQKGYMLHDKVIRTAKVKVSKKVIKTGTKEGD